jgi:hypothetical protein
MTADIIGEERAGPDVSVCLFDIQGVRISRIVDRNLAAADALL